MSDKTADQNEAEFLAACKVAMQLDEEERDEAERRAYNDVRE